MAHGDTDADAASDVASNVLPDGTRRRFLGTAGAALAVGLAGCGGNTGGDGGDGDADPSPTATDTEGGGGGDGEAASVTIANVGASAWEVTEDSTGSLAPTGEENPTMTFEVGTRYEFENGGWSAHPFALRASDDSPLLSQSADGSYADDDAVDWVDDGDTFAFTMTEALAGELEYYICTVHSSMRGDATTA
jgi:plastocyanin